MWREPSNSSYFNIYLVHLKPKKCVKDKCNYRTEYIRQVLYKLLDSAWVDRCIWFPPTCHWFNSSASNSCYSLPDLRNCLQVCCRQPNYCNSDVSRRTDKEKNNNSTGGFSYSGSNLQNPDMHVLQEVLQIRWWIEYLSPPSLNKQHLPLSYKYGRRSFFFNTVRLS